MLRSRVIPCLLLANGGLVKTVKFDKRTYLGDPINVIRIFNDKEVDEIALLDINATLNAREPDYALLEKIASQCFMPLAYGGGITRFDQIKRLLSLGIEKVLLNTAAINNPELIVEASAAYGRQAIVGSIDAKKSWLGRYDICTNGGKKSRGLTPVECAQALERSGCGEILINSIDRDGMMQGYDTELVRSIVEGVNVPVIACGGAGSIDDIASIIKETGVSGAAAGSLFVFHGRHRAVLINYPSQDMLAAKIGKRSANVSGVSVSKEHRS